MERNELNTQTDDFESVWIEIKNKKSKNIVCGCIYRHPSGNLKEFLAYMEKCLSKLSKENKEIYISGDFNIDLLKLETKSSYEEFYNLLTSFGFLPQITDPTRVTDSTATVIDNIFVNYFDSKTLSGNIMINFSEHFCQFVSVNRKKIDLKKANVYKRDYSKFNTQSFRDDISIQKWDNTYDNVNDQFNDFYGRLENCVDRHAPMKKQSFKQLKLESKPWITPEIKRLIEKRNKLF